MTLIKGLFAAGSGLSSYARGLGVSANNIANSLTPGFKPARTEFRDVLAESGRLSLGSGVRAGVSRNPVRQGSFERTGRGLDLAIDGDGLFAVQDPRSGERSYTRAGNFHIGANGDVLDQNGLQVLGYAAGGGGAPQPLNVSSLSVSAQATSSVSIQGNLSANSPLVAPGNLPVAGSATYQDYQADATLSSSFDVNDSLGASHSVTTYFYHTANTPSPTYEYRTVIDGAEVGGAAGTPVELASGTLTFAGDGTRQGPVPASDATLSPAYSNGAAAGNISLSFEGFTQYATGASSVSAVSQDGAGAGSVVGVFVERDGNVAAQLDNGETASLGRVAIARFQNPEGLTPVGGTRFTESATSGPAIYGAPGDGASGSIASGSLESSTVDLADEFINAISFQRGFEANARIIKTIDELLKEVTDLG